MSKLSMLLVSIFAFLSPIIPFFFLTGFIICIDTYYGRKLARKENRFKSRMHARIIYKLIIYNTAIVTSFLLDEWLLGEAVQIYSPVSMTVTKVGVLFVLINELVSVDEKLIGLTNFGLRHHLYRMLRIAKSIKNEKDSFNK